MEPTCRGAYPWALRRRRSPKREAFQAPRPRQTTPRPAAGVAKLSRHDSVGSAPILPHRCRPHPQARVPKGPRLAQRRPSVAFLGCVPDALYLLPACGTAGREGRRRGERCHCNGHQLSSAAVQWAGGGAADKQTQRSQRKRSTGTPPVPAETWEGFSGPQQRQRRVTQPLAKQHPPLNALGRCEGGGSYCTGGASAAKAASAASQRHTAPVGGRTWRAACRRPHGGV